MSLFYSLAYRLGFTPWEHAANHPPAAQHVAALFDREGHGRHRPFGRALDVGCGTGHWAIDLARRGWSVTGVDIVPTALRRARDRAIAAQVEVQFVEGDITALRTAGIRPGFDLVWDFGTIHGLTRDQQRAAGREIDAVASADAAVLLLAWAPGQRGPLPHGMSRDDVAGAFPEWRITSEEAFDATGLPGPLRNVDPRVYRLRRA